LEVYIMARIKETREELVTHIISGSILLQWKKNPIQLSLIFLLIIFSVLQIYYFEFHHTNILTEVRQEPLLEKLFKIKKGDVGTYFVDNYEERNQFFGKSNLSVCQTTVPYPSNLKQLSRELSFDSTSETPNYASTPAVRASNRGIPKFPPKKPANPLVSIIVPYFNEHHHFDEMLLSVQSQTLRHFEILIINDQSNDFHSKEKLKEVSKSPDGRIAVIDTPSKLGIAGTQNFGAQLASSQLIYWLRASDMLEPTALEKMVWFLESHSMFAWVGCFSVGFGTKEYLMKENFQTGEEVIMRHVENGAALFRRSAHEKVSGFNEHMSISIEWDYYLSMASEGLWGHTIPEYLFWKRHSEPEVGQDEWGSLDREDINIYLKGKYSSLALGFPQPHIPFTFDEGFNWEVQQGHLALDSSSLHVMEKSERLLVFLPDLAEGNLSEIMLNIINNLIEHNWSVTVICTNINTRSVRSILFDYVHHEDICGGLYSRFLQLTDDIFCLSSFLFLPSVTDFMQYIFGTRKPNVVLLSASELAYRILPWMYTSFPASYYIDLLHDVGKPHSAGFPTYSMSDQPFLDQTFVTSQKMQRWLLKSGMPSEKIFLHPALFNIPSCEGDLGTLSPRDKGVLHHYGIKKSHDDALTIVYVGEFIPKNRPQMVLDIARMLYADKEVKKEAWHVIMIGDGPLYDSVYEDYNQGQGLAYSLFRHHIIFHKSLPHQDILKILSASDVLLFPSHDDELSVYTPEAMSRGLTILASDVGAQSELIKEKTGYLMPVKEDKEVENLLYVNILKKFIQSPELIQEKGIEAKKFICQRNPDIRHGFCKAGLAHRFKPPIEVKDVLTANTFFGIETMKNEHVKHDILVAIQRKSHNLAQPKL